MLALWEARAEVTVSSEKQIILTAFPILGHQNKEIFSWFEVITAGRGVCRKEWPNSFRRLLINGAKRTPAKAGLNGVVMVRMMCHSPYFQGDLITFCLIMLIV